MSEIEGLTGAVAERLDLDMELNQFCGCDLWSTTPKFVRGSPAVEARRVN